MSRIKFKHQEATSTAFWRIQNYLLASSIYNLEGFPWLYWYGLVSMNLHGGTNRILRPEKAGVAQYIKHPVL